MSTSTIVYGLYQGQLLPHRLGGLCRGVEWWVEGPFLKTRVPLQRNILSAGKFYDGDVHSSHNQFGAGVGAYKIAELLWRLMSDHTVVAVIEDGTTQSPENIFGRETYSLSRMGMSKVNQFARWEKRCETLADVEEALEHGAKAFILDPETREETDVWNPVTPIDVEDLDAPPLLPELLRRAVHWLVGTSNVIGDNHRYVPQALWQVTEYCRGVVVLHADRDTDCIALYAKDTVDWSEKMAQLPSVSEQREFLIPCSVPTMTLRWKRALYEACDNWEGECPEVLRAMVPVREEVLEASTEVSDNDVVVEDEIVADNATADTKHEASEQESESESSSDDSE